jgi:membrane fusion protein (multidrug efflux system)
MRLPSISPTFARKAVLPLAALLIAGVAVTACGKKQEMPQGGPTDVGVVVVSAAPVHMTTELSGRTSAYLSSDVRPQVGGLIKARLFTEGGYVKQGQPLYQIDPAPFQAQYASAQAALSQAKAGLTTAQLKADRYAELVKINGVSKQENDDAQAALAQAQAAVQSAQALVQTAGINVGYTKVLAPISGRIGISNVTPGALVTASQATELTRIQNIDQVYLDISQSANDLMALKTQMASGAIGKPDTADVELVLDNGTVYPLHGKLQVSDVTVDPATGTVTLRALFPNPNGTLLPGMFAKARIVSGVVSNGILVPQAGVTRDPQGNATVMIVGKDSKAESRTITVAQTVGDKWLVTGGLQSGDKVIVEGLQKIRPDAPVKPTVLTATEK